VRRFFDVARRDLAFRIRRQSPVRRLFYDQLLRGLCYYVNWIEDLCKKKTLFGSAMVTGSNLIRSARKKITSSVGSLADGMSDPIHLFLISIKVDFAAETSHGRNFIFKLPSRGPRNSPRSISLFAP
jgi:hypothetical protein